MAKESYGVKWYLVFDVLAKTIVEHYRTYIGEGPAVPGEQLYQILLRNEDFRRHHTWIKKFDVAFGVKSVDPVHLFASFNSGTSPVRNRTIRIEAIFKALNIPIDFREINFDGCPAPQARRILSVRKSEEQGEIWELFQRAYREGIEGIGAIDFNRFKNWYGIELASFTIFLYWIRSDEFLPIDGNTRTFLTAARVIPYAPKDYNDYIQLMRQLGRFNDKELYREITHTSYKVVKQGIKVDSYSLTLSDILQSVRLFPGGEVYDEPAQPPAPPMQVNTTEISKLAHLGLKLIAIRPGANCNPNFLNVLKSEQIYQFETTITIDEEGVITYNEAKHLQLYDIRVGDDDILKINVTAIVGKNGSGKSSLVELLFRIINNLAYKYKAQLKTETLQIIPDLEAELYYLINGKLLCLELTGNSIRVQEYRLVENVFEKKGANRDFTFDDFQNWFYTIAVILHKG